MNRTASTWCVGPAAAHAIVPAPLHHDAWELPVLPCADPAHLRLVHARAALARGDRRAALAAFDDAVELDPTLAMAHLGRALCLAELGETALAGDALLDALALPDPDGAVSLQVARLVAREGDHRAALDLLSRALAADPGLAHQAADDAAFRTMRDHPAFLQMVGRI